LRTRRRDVHERKSRIEKIARWQVAEQDLLRGCETHVLIIGEADEPEKTERRDDALLYRQLATLVDAVPLDDSLEDLQFRGVPRERFERWCDELGVERLKTVPKRWM